MLLVCYCHKKVNIITEKFSTPIMFLNIQKKIINLTVSSNLQYITLRKSKMF